MARTLPKRANPNTKLLPGERFTTPLLESALVYIEAFRFLMQLGQTNTN